MIGRIMSVCAAEWTKAIRSPFTFVAPIAIGVTVLTAPLTHGIARDGISDYDFLAYAIPLAVNLIGLFIVLVYCSSLIASETQSGTLRTLLLRPLRRSDFFAAKSLVAFLYALGNVLLATGLGLGVVIVVGDLNGVHVGGEILYTNAQMMLALAVVVAATLLPVFAAVSLAIFISVCTRTPALAAALTIGIWLFVDLSKYPLHYWRFSFTSYFESPWNIYADMANGMAIDYRTEAIGLGATSIVSILLFLGCAFLLLNRRDITP